MYFTGVFEYYEEAEGMKWWKKEIVRGLDPNREYEHSVSIPNVMLDSI